MRSYIYLFFNSLLLLCISVDVAHAAPFKIALVMKSLANEFFQIMEDGARTHQNQHLAQYDLIANGIKDEVDTAGQIKIVEQMVAQHVDAIVIAPADSKALIPVVKIAIDRGILVVNIDNQFNVQTLREKGINVPFVGSDNRAAAKMVGDYLGKQLQPGDKVGILEGISTSFNGQQRTLGFQDAMQAAGAQVVSVQSGQWEIAKANTVVSAMLREHPDLKALLCGNDSMAVGAVSAVKSAGKTNKVKIIGFDNIAAIKPMLSNGRVLATVDQAASQQAVLGIETALKALGDKTPQQSLPARIITPVMLVTH